MLLWYFLIIPTCFFDVVSLVRHRDVTVGFPLLKYSVVCTVESLSLFISSLYLDLYVLGYDTSISKQSFMQNQTSMGLDPHQNYG